MEKLKMKTKTTNKTAGKKVKNSIVKKMKTYVDKGGYRRFCGTRRSVHRFVAARKLGRKLRPGEVVHHINRNKLDNSPKNLQVFPSQQIHNQVHLTSKRLTGKW